MVFFCNIDVRPLTQFLTMTTFPTPTLLSLFSQQPSDFNRQKRGGVCSSWSAAQGDSLPSLQSLISQTLLTRKDELCINYSNYPNIFVSNSVISSNSSKSSWTSNFWQIASIFVTQWWRKSQQVPLLFSPAWCSFSFHHLQLIRMGNICFAQNLYYNDDIDNRMTTTTTTRIQWCWRWGLLLI